MTILWLIERLLVKPTEGSNTDVVITADWRCNGSQESFSGTCYGSCSFAPPTGSFTPYDQLTEQQVLGWCFSNGVDQAAIEANVSLQIQNQINPPVVSLPLPWIEVVPPLVEQRIPQLKPHQIVDPLNLPTSDVPPSVDGMTDTILG
jgi:hypothetical protein